MADMGRANRAGYNSNRQGLYDWMAQLFSGGINPGTEVSANGREYGSAVGNGNIPAIAPESRNNEQIMANIARNYTPQPVVRDNETMMRDLATQDEYVAPVSKPKPKAKARKKVRTKKKPAVSGLQAFFNANDAAQNRTNSSAGVPTMSNADRLAMLRYNGDGIMY